jgi:hypothetical protein
MRKISQLSTTGLLLGYTLQVERNKCDPKTGNNSQKGPPGLKKRLIFQC